MAKYRWQSAMDLDLVARAVRDSLHSLEVGRGEVLVAAFSGGPDSTALLVALSQVARGHRCRVHAAHLDHGLDTGSAQRAHRAALLAHRLEVPFSLGRWDDAREVARQGVEAAAREARYAFLEELRSSLGARFVATAHHRDDQVETVLLRILQGSGLEGLAGIQRQRGAVIRPLLDLPRQSLRGAVAEAGLTPVEDPTNHDLSRPRNFIRHTLLPYLRREHGLRDEDVAALAGASSAAFRHMRRMLGAGLEPRRARWGLEVSRRAFEELPGPLQTPALALLHRLAGARHPASGKAREELARQLGARSRIGCDCGGGWRWESRGDRLRLRRAQPPAPLFTYTLPVPGVVHIPEVSLAIRVRRGSVQPEMLQGSSHRAALALALLDGGRVTIRSRRAGDRIRLPGCSKARRLKDVLHDHGVPAEERDRLPLLCVGDMVAWVPGVAVDDRARAREGTRAWVVEAVAGASRPLREP